MRENTKEKKPVKIRFKALKDGNKSVYLDTYIDGRREYTFLKLYIVPEKTPLDKRQNANTMVLATKAQSEKIIELTSGRYGVVRDNNKTVSELLQVYSDYNVNNCRNKQSFYNKINSLRKHLAIFGLLERRAATVTDKDIMDFVVYMKKAGLKDSTANGCKIDLKACFRYATSQGLLKSNPFDKVGKLPLKKQKRQLPVYLEKSEIERLQQTAVNTSKYTKDIPNAFMFSCLTGLRLSDVIGLKPEHVKADLYGNKIIRIHTQKTGQVVSFPLPRQAEKYMQSNYTNTNGYVFKLPSHVSINLFLKRWASAAGIDKNIHFHTARHTFATLAISAGVPIEVVRDFLGHSDIATTLIYAEITKEKKRLEIDKLNTFLG